MYTDGLTDADGDDEEYFGERRLYETAARAAKLAPHACVDAFFAAVDAFRNGAPQQDDETIVVIDRLP